jgi:hypothetical protein
MDIDVLGIASNEEAGIVLQIRDILAANVVIDGLAFDTDAIQAERIVEDADYEGIRIRFLATLGSAKIHMRIDIGFGDVVYPDPEESDLPTLLDFPPPRLLCYSRESSISEKFEAMVKLGALNSRMKDFYDIWLLSRQFDFDGVKLTEAIRRTFERRGTKLPLEIEAFAEPFIQEKQTQWTAFWQKTPARSCSLFFWRNRDFRGSILIAYRFSPFHQHTKSSEMDCAGSVDLICPHCIKPLRTNQTCI